MIAPAGTLWVDGWVWDALKRTSLEDSLVSVLAVICASQKEEERGGEEPSICGLQRVSFS